MASSSCKRTSKLKPQWDDSIHDLPSMYHIPGHLKQCKKDAKSTRFQPDDIATEDRLRLSRTSRLSSSRSSDISSNHRRNTSKKNSPIRNQSNMTNQSAQHLLDNMEFFTEKMNYCIECINQNMDDNRFFRTEVQGTLEHLRLRNEDNCRVLQDIVRNSAEFQAKVNSEMQLLQSQISSLSQQILNAMAVFSSRESVENVIRNPEIFSSDHPDRITEPDATTSKLRQSDQTRDGAHSPRSRKTVLPARYALITDENSVQPIRVRYFNDRTNSQK